MKNTSDSCLRVVARLVSAVVMACMAIPALAGHGERGDQAVHQCVLACDDANVAFSTDLAGPGSDLAGAKNMARKRYTLCLYHCDPRLTQHGTLMRLFPPVGRLSAITRSALSSADQLRLCEQDCSTSQRLCTEAQFENSDLCINGAKACQTRCDEAFGSGKAGVTE